MMLTGLSRAGFVRHGAVATRRRLCDQAVTRPFRVLGLQQVAIGGKDKQALSALWNGILGVEKVHSFRSERENVDEDVLRLGSGPLAVELDLMQPIDPTRSPKVHEPPLNHIGIWVHPLKEAVEYLTKRGVRFAPGGIRKGASGYDITFIHPKGNAAALLSGEGVLIELVDAPPEVVAAFDTIQAAAEGKKKNH